MYRTVVPPDYRVPPHPDGGRPDYHLFLPVNWRADQSASADAGDRIAAAERAGLRRFVERLNVSRALDRDLSPRPGRLRFTPVDDHDAVVEVFRRVCADTLDADSRRDARRHGPRHAAEIIVGDAFDQTDGQQWWRLGYDGAGDVVGAVLPVRPGAATIWHVGVVPEHRGHRYVDDLVIEALHVLADAGETRVADNTDVGNAPMIASFARCGYHTDGYRMVFV
jgi:ribosomal protein S18 acetylase RimI-like enzyme